MFDIIFLNSISTSIQSIGRLDEQMWKWVCQINSEFLPIYKTKGVLNTAELNDTADHYFSEPWWSCGIHRFTRPKT